MKIMITTTYVYKTIQWTNIFIGKFYFTRCARFAKTIFICSPGFRILIFLTVSFSVAVTFMFCFFFYRRFCRFCRFCTFCKSCQCCQYSTPLPSLLRSSHRMVPLSAWIVFPFHGRPFHGNILYVNIIFYS